MNMIGVLAGMYMGVLSPKSNVASDLGNTTGWSRVSRMLCGTGGKRRRVSLMTARTESVSVKGWDI